MLRFALVQAGDRADTFVRVASRLKGGAITAVVEPLEEAAHRLSHRLEVSVSATSVEQLHEQHDDDFDAWLAVTPYGLIMVPQAGRPLDLRPERWSNHPSGWLWGHEYRFLPSIRTVRESFDSGQLGVSGLIRIHHWQTIVAGDAMQTLLPQLDLACWLVDQPLKTLFAQTRQRPPNVAPSRDYVQVHLGFADDRMAVIDCSTSLPAGDDYYSLSVIGSAGAAYADDHRSMQLVFGGGHPQALRTAQGDQAVLSAIQEFIDDVAKARAPSCGAAEWSRARRIATAVEQSLASSQSVSLMEGDTR